MRQHRRVSSAGRWLLASLVVGATLSTAVDAQAAPPPKATVCVGCHGADGIGKAPQYPNLRGQKAGYIQKQLKAFRSGERKDPFMSNMAKPLSDTEIAALAAFFEGLK